MSTTFDGLSFGVIVSDGFVPLPERQLVWSTEHIPWGDVNVNESGGLGPLSYRVTIRVLKSAEASWRAKLGLVKVLIVNDVNYGSLRLVALTNIRQTPHPSPAIQYLLADAEWSE